MKHYTVTVESNTKIGKALITAKNYTEALGKAKKACPAGFWVSEVLDNSKHQIVSRRMKQHAQLTRGLSSSHGRIAERCEFYAPANRSEVQELRASREASKASEASKSSKTPKSPSKAKPKKAKVKKLKKRRNFKKA